MGNKKNIRRAIKRTYSMKQKHMMEVVNKKKRMASNPSADEPSEKTFHKLQKYSEHEIPGTSLSVATIVTPKADPNSSDNETITGDVLFVEPKTEPQEDGPRCLLFITGNQEVVVTLITQTNSYSNV